ncbi:hypothetical protein ACJD0Z_18425 [Flavobacteriaceae bacterium M23B6Z8]
MAKGYKPLSGRFGTWDWQIFRGVYGVTASTVTKSVIRLGFDSQ